MRLFALAVAFVSAVSTAAAPYPGSQRVKICDDVNQICQSLSGSGATPVYESFNTSATYCRILVGTATPVALRCGSSNLANRRKLLVFNNGTYSIYLGYDTSLTTASGFPLPGLSGGLLSATGFAVINLDVGPNVTLYAISTGIGNDVRIMEGS